MLIYGYYSATQASQSGKTYVYLDNTGKEVYVSEVISSNKLEDNEKTKYFNDNNYIGELKKFIRVIKSIN